jgi:hypothetical protein
MDNFEFLVTRIDFIDLKLIFSARSQKFTIGGESKGLDILVFKIVDYEVG